MSDGKFRHSAERLNLRDEVLQALHWVAGEGIEADMDAAGIARLLGRPKPDVARALEDGLRAGLVEVASGSRAERYQLTKAGRSEGQRRFEEEFSGIIGHGGHGLCSDPDCDCHDSDEAALACLQEKGAHP